MKRTYHMLVSCLLAVIIILLPTTAVLAQDETPTATPAATATVAPTEAPAATNTPTRRPTTAPTATPTAAPTTAPAATSALTQVVSSGVELTVYNQNIALVKDTRQLTLTTGINLVQFGNVTALIDPTSVHFTSLTDPLGTLVLEQNYVYDLVDTSKLISKYIDQQIQVRTSAGDVYTGTLLSGSGDLIMQVGSGIKVIKQDQVQEFTFPVLPSGLVTRPALDWLITSTIPGAHQVRVTYLTGGLNWRANYVALLSAQADTIDLNGWITLQNDSGTTFNDVRLKLVAGDINLVQQLAPVPSRAAIAYAEETQAGVQERTFFEYHLYEVQRPVTVRSSEIKQIEFIGAPTVAAARIYVYEATPRYFGYGYTSDAGDYSDPSAKVQVRVQFSNTISNGLGIPLPMGTVRVYQQDTDGSAEFVGEDAIDHTPRDESVSLQIGNAFDIVAERKQVQYRQLSNTSAQETWDITLRNHKQEAVTVQVIENLFRALDAEILSSSLGYEKVAANRIRFDVALEPDGEQTLTYTVLYRW